MALTPVDISHKDFKRKFRGYSVDEVDEFVEKLAKEYEKLYQENYMLQESKASMEKKLEHYNEIEESLRDALILAQDTAEITKENARKEAALIISEAKQRAEKITNDCNAQVDYVMKRLEELKNEERFFRMKFKTLLESHLELNSNQEDEEMIEQKMEEATAELENKPPIVEFDLEEEAEVLTENKIVEEEIKTEVVMVSEEE